jgi:ribosomal protein S18 acetylase RimI-like enzyme
MIQLTVDRWLGEIMGVRAYRASGSLMPAEAQQAAQVLRSIASQPSFVHARVPSRDLATAHGLEMQGFRLVDTNVTLETDALLPGLEAQTAARTARPEDAPAVEQIARRGFEVSRFHLDPELRPGLANEIKAQWAANFFRGQRGDFMVVAECEGGVAGFLQLLVAPEAVLVIDLIAVEPQFRGRGLASAMIRYAASTCGTPRRLRVGTQIANVGSLALYQRLGFRITASAHVFHLHGPRAVPIPGGSN